jgi:tripartite-type tricarboxylate transporter receptor subunit TctC
MFPTRKIFVPLAALALTGIAPLAHAQAYPTKAVRVVVPVAPGGGTDFLARLLSLELTERAGHTFVVDNRAGAGGAIGSQLVASAPPDGYTLMMGYTASHGINPALSKLSYDPVKNFTQISLVATATNMLVVHPSVAVRSVQELIALAKSKPGHLRYASAGNGTAPHMSGALFDLMAGTEMIHVPYKGNGPALVDVLGGHIELTFASLPAGLPHGKAGKLRMVAVTSPKRSTLMPDLPTVAESGLPGFNTDQWYGMVAPAALPEPLVTRLHKDILSSVQDKDFVEKARGQGFEIVGSTPAQFRTHIASEVAKWKDVVKKGNIRAD